MKVNIKKFALLAWLACNASLAAATGYLTTFSLNLSDGRNHPVVDYNTKICCNANDDLFVVQGNQDSFSQGNYNVTARKWNSATSTWSQLQYSNVHHFVVLDAIEYNNQVICLAFDNDVSSKHIRIITFNFGSSVVNAINPTQTTGTEVDTTGHYGLVRSTAGHIYAYWSNASNVTECGRIARLSFTNGSQIWNKGLQGSDKGLAVTTRADGTAYAFTRGSTAVQYSVFSQSDGSVVDSGSLTGSSGNAVGFPYKAVCDEGNARIFLETQRETNGISGFLNTEEFYAVPTGSMTVSSSFEFKPWNGWESNGELFPAGLVYVASTGTLFAAQGYTPGRLNNDLHAPAQSILSFTPSLGVNAFPTVNEGSMAGMVASSIAIDYVAGNYPDNTVWNFKSLSSTTGSSVLSGSDPYVLPGMFQQIVRSNTRTYVSSVRDDAGVGQQFVTVFN